MGAKAAAIADIAKALEIAPNNIAANRRMLAWATEPQQETTGRRRPYRPREQSRIFAQGDPSSYAKTANAISPMSRFLLTPSKDGRYGKAKRPSQFRLPTTTTTLARSSSRRFPSVSPNMVKLPTSPSSDQNRQRLNQFSCPLPATSFTPLERRQMMTSRSRGSTGRSATDNGEPSGHRHRAGLWRLRRQRGFALTPCSMN